MKNIRVRYAPSPTGPQHIGGVRTALFNYLFAKKNNGTFILRVEDTDQSRYKEGSIEYLIKSLKWLSIEPDEGYNYDGNYGPYLQSKRTKFYQKYIQELIDKDCAYYAFDTIEELDLMREKMKSDKIAAPSYNSSIRMLMRNSLTLSKQVVEEKLKNNEPYVIRLKIPRKKVVRFKDIVRGWISVNAEDLDDKILLKSDGLPTYHFASVVDDHLMKISHVIRGEEWLPSAPIHVLLYEFFNWEQPLFAHLPLILKSNSKGKLSKRDSQKYGFPVFPLQWQDQGQIFKGFKEEGYLPQATLNFLSLLGWNPGTNKEIFTREELINKFSLERINKSGVKFDIDKVKWFNREYIKKLSNEYLSKFLEDNVLSTKDYSDYELNAICQLLKDKITFVKDLITESVFFFSPPKNYNISEIKKYLNKENIKILISLKNDLSQLENFSKEDIKAIIYSNILKKFNTALGKFLPILRYALTGSTFGADLMSIISILNKERTLNRIDAFLKIVS